MAATNASAAAFASTGNAAVEDMERIYVYLSELPEHLATVAFAADVFTTGLSFSSLSNAYVRIVNADTNQELGRLTLTSAYLGPMAESRVVLLARLRRLTNGGAEALWLVSPEVTVTDKSTLRVFGSLSVDGGPVGGGPVGGEPANDVARFRFRFRFRAGSRGDCGGGLNCSTHGHQSFGAAVSLVQLSTGSPFARIVDSWSNASYALEGQDVDDDGKHLVVADLMQGRLLSFNTSCLKCGPRHESAPDARMALHRGW